MGFNTLIMTLRLIFKFAGIGFPFSSSLGTSGFVSANPIATKFLGSKPKYSKR